MRCRTRKTSLWPCTHASCSSWDQGPALLGSLQPTNSRRQGSTTSFSSPSTLTSKLLRAPRIPLRSMQVDVLLFNPPYVPTPSDEVGSIGIEAAWAGGKHGREVIDRVLPLVHDVLTPRGVFYMVVVAENKPNDIARIMLSQGFHMETIRSRKAFNESLSIVKFTRTPAQ
ncbi:hypothetical protein, variant 2 [Aphanomyces invadans]|uniref:Methyltransferase small domain-containing protein n=1 Tax=Aphanomyces invadans TaxID=157072 RepID=A0A024UFP1_9STRA|nr:hypothetical protein, variant 2 [Aphanomyces invadans]ETW04418.1 hypothetical protein, variant 2 [Aphanomyces invadans]|eukprot:XP_008867374.1 hypothetical protein, variant 2 [Aphanomyces invadans]